jgi:membrane-bound lytic murein transglycosylase D
MITRRKAVSCLYIFLTIPLILLPSCVSHPIRTPYIYPLPQQVLFAGEEVPVNHGDTYSRIITWFNFFLSKPWQVQLWLDKAEAIFPFVEEKLQERGMPLDLKYIAVAESYLNPRAISSAGAAGIWQFTERTGKAFGLKIDEFVDERYDYVPATEAALGYFEKAREATNSWILSCASFNLGITGVTDRIERQNTCDYWAMVFPPETEDYVPMVVAIKLIMENPGSMSFKAEKTARGVQRLELKTEEKPLYLTDLAQKINLTFREVWLLNPHIWKPYLPPGTYYFYLPDRPDISAREINTFINELPYTKESYILQTGEDLGSAAEKLGITKDEIESFNNLESLSDVGEGDAIIYWKLMKSE